MLRTAQFIDTYFPVIDGVISMLIILTSRLITAAFLLRGTRAIRMTILPLTCFGRQDLKYPL